MAIPSRQIGWGTEENLLYQISLQLERLIAVSKKGGSTPTGISVYSQQLEFPISYASISLQCNESNVQSYFTNGTANDMTELVNLFNSNDPSQFGVYSDGGNNILKLTITQATKNQYCPTGALTTNVFSD